MTCLSRTEALAMHRMVIELYGGSPGVRDPGLLDSALSQPEATFGGAYLHADVFEMAAAYAFHIAMNHPFVDGNKRVAAMAMLVFLKCNGVAVLAPEEQLYAVVIAITEGRLGKDGVAAWLRDHAS